MHSIESDLVEKRFKRTAALLTVVTLAVPSCVSEPDNEIEVSDAFVDSIKTLIWGEQPDGRLHCDNYDTGSDFHYGEIFLDATGEVVVEIDTSINHFNEELIISNGFASRKTVEYSFMTMEDSVPVINTHQITDNLSEGDPAVYDLISVNGKKHHLAFSLSGEDLTIKMQCPMPDETIHA